MAKYSKTQFFKGMIARELTFLRRISLLLISFRVFSILCPSIFDDFPLHFAFSPSTVSFMKHLRSKRIISLSVFADYAGCHSGYRIHRVCWRNFALQKSHTIYRDTFSENVWVSNSIPQRTISSFSFPNLKVMCVRHTSHQQRKYFRSCHKHSR